MDTYLVITTSMGFRSNIEVASWEEAVEHCKAVDNTFKEFGLEPDYKATFFEPENRSWQRIRNSDGSIEWQED